MSGGVDSAVAAARLLDQGYDVIGVTLHLWDYPESPDAKGRCCAPEDQYDARRTADALGFPHYTFDRRARFESEVIAPFVASYAAGITPSPCNACNRSVKLGELFSIADRLGARFLATGHYARIVRDDAGTPHLARGVDLHKDQSYFLYHTPTPQLGRLIFPLGESVKPDVRREALDRKLPGASKGESQELCFVGSGEYAKFVAARTVVKPGSFLDAEGRVVGQHDGVHHFTVGQRKGLGIALGYPAFVTRIDGDTGAVHLGPEAELLGDEVELREVHLAEGTTLPLLANLRIRYRHEGAAACVERKPDGQVVARFAFPVRALTEGQVAVFYEGDRVLGGAVIGRPNRRARGSLQVLGGAHGAAS